MLPIVAGKARIQPRNSLRERNTLRPTVENITLNDAEGSPASPPQDDIIILLSRYGTCSVTVLLFTSLPAVAVTVMV